MAWDPPVIDRSQIVLFSECLDEVLPSDHCVRRIVELLEQLDWSDWEREYKHEGRGKPPIHPRVMCGIILYGLMRGVRSSRQLEEALVVRLDFRWLAEARTIDHSTFCRFRQKHVDQLKALFVKITLIAKRAGLLSLVELAVDGTKIRANNHRSAKLKVKELAEWKTQLELRFKELNEQADQLDREKRVDPKNDRRLQNTQSRLAQISRAIEEVAQLEEMGEAIPQRIPTTDVQSRVTRSKEGSFAPNYTPVTAVDPTSGLIVATEVISGSDEKSVLPKVLDEVKAEHGELPERVLADTIYNHNTNLKAMEERGIELHAPIERTPNNPAIRIDPTQPVDSEQWSDLPVKKGKLTKEAFVYDAKDNCYYCPLGKKLTFSSSYKDQQANGEVIRHRYHANEMDCADCPLLDRCVNGKSPFRRVSRSDGEELRDRLRERAASDSGKEALERRMIAEHPFAMIKHHMGLRQFLHRGLDRVRQEWQWAVTAFNLFRLLQLQTRAGPDCPAPLPSPP